MQMKMMYTYERKDDIAQIEKKMYIFLTEINLYSSISGIILRKDIEVFEELQCLNVIDNLFLHL